MITLQTYIAAPGKAGTSVFLSAFSFRSNRKINAALRAAYRKFDRTAETEKLLRKYLPR